jgi:restriction system protein
VELWSWHYIRCLASGELHAQPFWQVQSEAIEQGWLGAVGRRTQRQAKRYAYGNNVGRPEVQAFVGSLVGLGATKGVFVTTSAFSNQALDFARHLSQRVILIDGPRLADLLIEHNVGVLVGRRVEFKRIDENFFSEED